MCRGHVKDISLRAEAKPCAMELMAKEFGVEKSCGLSASGNCCQDRSLKFEGNDYNYKFNKQLSLFSSVVISAVLPQPLFELFTTDSSDLFSYTQFKPPLIDRDIPVLVQSFLL